MTTSFLIPPGLFSVFLLITSVVCAVLVLLLADRQISCVFSRFSVIIPRIQNIIGITVPFMIIFSVLWQDLGIYPVFRFPLISLFGLLEVSKSPCVLVSRKMHMPFYFLHNSQWITLPTQSCLFLYYFCATLMHSLITSLFHLSSYKTNTCNFPESFLLLSCNWFLWRCSQLWIRENMFVFIC